MVLNKLLIVAHAGTPNKFHLNAQFNPKELNEAYNVSFGQGRPFSSVLEYTQAAQADLKLMLVFDGLEEKINVRRHHVHRLAALIDTGFETPPITQLVWGSHIFEGAVVALDVKYTMFLPDGSPCRAEVNLSMRRASAILHGQNWRRAAGR